MMPENDCRDHVTAYRHACVCALHLHIKESSNLIKSYLAYNNSACIHNKKAILIKTHTGIINININNNIG